MELASRSVSRLLSPWIFALAIAILAVGLRLLLDPLLGDQYRLITTYAAIAITVWRHGAFPALLTTIACYLLTYLVYFVWGNHQAEPRLVQASVFYFFACLLIISLGESIRRARASIQERNEVLDSILSGVVDAIIGTDARGRINRINHAACKLTGYQAQEALGHAVQAVCRLEDARKGQPLDALIARCLEQGKVLDLPADTVLRGGDDQPYLVAGRAVPVCNRKGQVTGCVLTFRDETARRRQTEQLRRSERELSSFFETAVIGMHWVDAQGNITRANQAMLDMLGYSRAEYVGHNLRNFHADSRALEEFFQHLQSGKTLRDVTISLRRKDGGIEHVLVNSNGLFENGRFLHSRCFMRSVSDRRQVEETRAQLAAIVAASQDAIISKSLDGIIRSWNAGARALFGYSEEEMLGRPISTIIPPERHQEEEQIIARIRRGERVDHFETVRLRKDGSHIDVSVAISPIFDEQGRVVAASKVARNITESKIAEQKLLEADRRKDEFLAMLAHELRNPLAPISNAVEILKFSEGDAKLTSQARDTIERQLNQMVRLVDDLLNISRITRDKLRLQTTRVELAAIVQQALETVQPVIHAQGHKLSLSLPEETVYLAADPVRLAQVLSNLLNNACKFTEPGGRIALSAERRGEQVLISVKDSGTGIAADQLEVIFGMFTQSEATLSRSRGGLGIGLTLARRLVEMHGGRIRAHSEGLGRGSEFTIELPLWDLEATLVQPAVADSPAAARKRILVVDDNKDSAESLATLLKLNEHEVQVAYDGLAAVQRSELFRPELILLDIGLPKLNGFDACRRIRETDWGREITIVALTGWGQDKYRLQSEEAGFDAHIVKPVQFSALQALLERSPSTRKSNSIPS